MLTNLFENNLRGSSLSNAGRSISADGQRTRQRKVFDELSGQYVFMDDNTTSSGGQQHYFGKGYGGSNDSAISNRENYNAPANYNAPGSWGPNSSKAARSRPMEAAKLQNVPDYDPRHLGALGGGVGEYAKKRMGKAMIGNNDTMASQIHMGYDENNPGNTEVVYSKAFKHAPGGGSQINFSDTPQAQANEEVVRSKRGVQGAAAASSSIFNTNPAEQPDQFVPSRRQYPGQQGRESFNEPGSEYLHCSVIPDHGDAYAIGNPRAQKFQLRNRVSTRVTQAPGGRGQISSNVTDVPDFNPLPQRRSQPALRSEVEFGADEHLHPSSQRTRSQILHERRELSHNPNERGQGVAAGQNSGMIEQNSYYQVPGGKSSLTFDRFGQANEAQHSTVHTAAGEVAVKGVAGVDTGLERYAAKGHSYVEPTTKAAQLGAAGTAQNTSANVSDQKYGSQVKLSNYDQPADSESQRLGQGGKKMLGGHNRVETVGGARIGQLGHLSNRPPLGPSGYVNPVANYEFQSGPGPGGDVGTQGAKWDRSWLAQGQEAQENYVSSVVDREPEAAREHIMREQAALRDRMSNRESAQAQLRAELQAQEDELAQIRAERARLAVRINMREQIVQAQQTHAPDSPTKLGLGGAEAGGSSGFSSAARGAPTETAVGGTHSQNFARSVSPMQAQEQYNAGNYQQQAQAGQYQQQQQQQNAHGGVLPPPVEQAKYGSNHYRKSGSDGVSTAGQNLGNSILGKPSSRVLAPPGGKSNFSFG